MRQVNETPVISLVVAVYGQAPHLRRLLNSIVAQELKAIQVIVVDQNVDDSLQDVICDFMHALAIVHLRCAPGLSRARNLGLAHASGSVIGFPDDDCWYPTDFLSTVLETLAEHSELGGLTCRCTDEAGRLAAGGDGRCSAIISKRTVWSQGVSATLFLRTGVMGAVRAFEPTLGLGSGTPYLSGEETDVLLRAIEMGHRILYRADLRVFHPLPPDPSESGASRRARAYGRGMGRVLRLHRFGPGQVVTCLIQPCLGALWALLTGRPALARVRVARAQGRLEGWLGVMTNPIGFAS